MDDEDNEGQDIERVDGVIVDNDGKDAEILTGATYIERQVNRDCIGGG